MLITIEKTITLEVEVRCTEPGQRAITSGDPNSCQPEIKPEFVVESVRTQLDGLFAQLYPSEILNEADYAEIQRLSEEEIGWNV